jgi:hypothetical protein
MMRGGRRSAATLRCPGATERPGGMTVSSAEPVSEPKGYAAVMLYGCSVGRLSALDI